MTRLTFLFALLLLGGCSQNQDDLRSLINGDCAGSSSVRCVAAHADLAVLQTEEALEKSQDKEYRDQFIAQKGKQAYREYVLGLHEQRIAAETLVISGSTTFFMGDKPFSPRYLKYYDDDLAREKSKDIIRERIAFAKGLDKDLAKLSDTKESNALLKMDVSDLGDTPQIAGSEEIPDAMDYNSAADEGGSSEPMPSEEAFRSASFDCAMASTSIEKMICADPGLSSLDSKLAEVYGLLKNDAESGEYFRSEQRAWLKVKRASCADIECLTSRYTERIEELETAYQQKAHNPGLH